jgi:hypothetical protein
VDITNGQGTAVTIRAELEEARTAFHALLDSLSDEDLRRQSNNPGWTNGEVLFHMTLAFNLVPFLAPLLRLFGRLPRRCSRLFAGILDAGTGLFNLANGLGPRIGGRIFSRERLRAQFDHTHRAILKLVASTKDGSGAGGCITPRGGSHCLATT